MNLIVKVLCVLAGGALSIIIVGFFGGLVCGLAACCAWPVSRLWFPCDLDIFAGPPTVVGAAICGFVGFFPGIFLGLRFGKLLTGETTKF